MSGLPKHLLLPSFLVLLPFFLLLILTPPGEGIKCFECVWWEKNNTLKLDFERSNFCSYAGFNHCRAPAKSYHDGYLCVSILPKKDVMDGVVMVGLPHHNVSIPKKCAEDGEADVRGQKIKGKVCVCDEDFCSVPPEAGSQLVPSLGTLLAAALAQKLV